MKLTTSQLISAAFVALITTVMPARASNIPISYSFTGTGTEVDSSATTLTLDASASGSFLSHDLALDASWNPITYTDRSVLDFTTNLLNGSFTISFADGDTLFGHVFEDQSVVDASPTQTGPFPQTLTITGGTGAFALASGSLSGEGFLGTSNFTVSGSGSIDVATAPEPASALLLCSSLVLLIGGLCRRAASGARCN